MVLVLKTELGGDLRRIPLHNDFLTFDELHMMLCRVYAVDIDDNDKVKYRDLDGDWITISDSNDLQLAIQTVQEANEKTLRLKIGSDGCGVSNDVINDLRSIRDMSIGLIGTCNKYLRKCKYTKQLETPNFLSPDLLIRKKLTCFQLIQKHVVFDTL
jgi:hypothetical protein